MIKFDKKIANYRYVLAFDLAKRVSGYTLWDFKEDKVLYCGIIDTQKAKSYYVWDYFYNQIKETIYKCFELVEDKELLFLTKEKLPTQNGVHSTINTLQGLAEAHAVFDLAVCHTGIQIYDYGGVHSVSVKAYFKSLLGIEKPQKEDIANYLQKRFQSTRFDRYTFDVTDSLAVAITLIEKKHITDIKEKIQELKKELKTIKSDNKQNKIKEEIEKLQTFLL